MAELPNDEPTLPARIFVAMQYVTPQHLVSRMVLLATRVQTPWFKNLLIRLFLKGYAVDMGEAEVSDPYAYASFNHFFTRALRPDARTLAAEPASIACPVDGTVSQSGEIVGGELLQAKGQNYTLKDLLAGQKFAERFEGGSFATIYLAPYNYHRIHMPRSGRVMETWYVPGKLFSVNRVTAQLVPRLFARNERVVCLFQAEFGQFAVVLVGALNVGSIATSWAGDVAPASTRKLTRLKDTPTTLVTGQELGRFNMGSTIILLFEPGHVRWQEDLRAGRTVRLGESIGSLR